MCKFANAQVKVLTLIFEDPEVSSPREGIQQHKNAVVLYEWNKIPGWIYLFIIVASPRQHKSP